MSLYIYESRYKARKDKGGYSSHFVVLCVCSVGFAVLSLSSSRVFQEPALPLTVFGGLWGYCVGHRPAGDVLSWMSPTLLYIILLRRKAPLNAVYYS